MELLDSILQGKVKMKRSGSQSPIVVLLLLRCGKAGGWRGPGWRQESTLELVSQHSLFLLQTCNDSRTPHNFSNKLELLRAEKSYYLGNRDCALLHYQNAINVSKKYRFIHEEGLAEENYATYLLHLHRNGDAYEHFKNACNCYKKWGAAVLVQRVGKVIGLLTPLCSSGKWQYK